MLLAFCTQPWWPAWRAGRFNLFHGLSMLETTEIVDSEVSAILDARQVRHPAGRRMAIQIAEREEHGKNLEMILLFEEGIYCHRPICVIWVSFWVLPICGRSLGSNLHALVELRSLGLPATTRTRRPEPCIADPGIYRSREINMTYYCN